MAVEPTLQHHSVTLTGDAATKTVFSPVHDQGRLADRPVESKIMLATQIPKVPFNLNSSFFIIVNGSRLI
jgi:hypothetical protein